MFNLKEVLKFLDKFFFEKRSTLGISFFRITWISLLLIYYLFDYGNIDDFYGPHALISLDTVKMKFPFFHANLFHLSNGGHSFTYGFYYFYGFALLSALVGFQTKISLISVLLCLVSFHQRNIWLLSSSEVLMRSITFFLLFTPSGSSLSIDSFLKKSHLGQIKFPKESIWGQRLIQIQLSVVYLWTVWHKLRGEAWFDGTAVYYATRLEGLTNLSLPYLMDSMLFLRFSTWGTLLIEFLLGTFIWFNEFRRPLIIIGIIFHLMIEYLFSIPFFEWCMILLLLNFFTSEEYQYLFSRMKRFFHNLLPAINK